MFIAWLENNSSNETKQKNENKLYNKLEKIYVNKILATS